ncbi:hypothetical protein [Variovorax sp. WDL1]|uniref:hypothetical protein n=1 Tax=Variovorax sp. WDL1 TaxID=207745 RepID=UPI00076D0492|nr:hypothetical protein [Variovorax sp. WDL1]KWT98168.1 hypothetical protein APY03_0839 [Variovorax sp. WDL1]PNG50345.1 hypothetical protein CHC06_05968 [Variovorax sp. B2]PNG51218.1 hypothetical protein CHC07_05874 [Variovorax sp. B4]
MLPYQDPHHPGNSAEHHTGKLCLWRCGRPAGTAWGPLLCFHCNVQRMDKLTDRFKLLEEHMERIAAGP